MLVTQEVGMGERKVKWSLIMWMISDRLSSRGEREVTCGDGCEIRDTRGALKGSKNWVGKVQLHGEKSHDKEG